MPEGAIPSASLPTSGPRLTLAEIKFSARILLYLAQQPKVEPDEIHPDSLTQGGIARALQSSQGAVSNALRRLADGGAVSAVRCRVPHRFRRVRAYQLTFLGEELVRRIQQSGLIIPG